MRQIIDLDLGWDFYEEGCDVGLKVDLPHSWLPLGANSRELAQLPKTGTYTREVTLDADQCSGSVWLELSGVSAVGTVYIDGTLLGTHIGAATRFRYDLTRLVKPMRPFVIKVEVDGNVRDCFSPYPILRGGIFGKVDIVCAPKTHFTLSDCGSDGIYVTPEVLESGCVRVKIHTVIENPINYDVISYVIYAPDDGIAASCSQQPKSPDAELIIADPLKWDTTSTANMYRLHAAIVRDGKIGDEVSVYFGIRTIEIDREGFFSVNGELRQPLFGAGLSADPWSDGYFKRNDASDVAAAAEIGMNCLCLDGTFATTDDIFSVCDKRGIVVMSAFAPLAPAKGESFGPRSQAGTYLEEFVKQTYNHPSILFRAVCRFPTEEQLRGRAAGFAAFGSMVRKLSPTTMTAALVDCDSVDKGLAPEADALTVLVRHGITGEEENLSVKWVESFKARSPGVNLSVACRGYSSTATEDASEEAAQTIQARYHELYWNALESRHGVFAIFINALFDNTMPEREADRRMGLVSADRTRRKNAYWFYKAMLGSDSIVRVAEIRLSDDRKTATIKVYSDEPKLELTVNGRPRRAKCVMTPGVLVFSDIKLPRGEAVIRFASRTLSDSVTLRR